MDPGINQLLKWSIENSTTDANATNGTAPHANGDSSAPAAPHDQSASSQPSTRLNPDALRALMGGPSDADLMIAAMQCLTSPTDPTDNTLDSKLIAFDNFEQLIENLDNANNLSSTGLWTPLISLLSDSESEIRRYAAWCCGTAVQNNLPSQERLLVVEGLKPLVHLAVNDSNDQVRRKACYALSSAVRNYMPALVEVRRLLEGEGIKVEGEDARADAADMDAVDRLLDRIKSEGRARAGALS